MQLTKGMYGSEFRRQSDLFGLRCGQMRSGTGKLTHNSGWYSAAGEKLGFGDLSKDDLLRVSAELDDGELFIVLGEQDSFWNFVTRPGIIGSQAQTKPDVEAPGREYVAAKCMILVQKGQVHFVNDYEPTGRTGLHFPHLSQEDAQRIIASVAS
ncbi:MAG: hypothetical protein Greene041619_714 [Candidatus Peregrinibacteria bacterium Greene0416_19]|nr:MAG: hypothetical protein Greene041619_714 [Candidatus Peregrinibacteria bacterium Greene0416_19]